MEVNHTIFGLCEVDVPDSCAPSDVVGFVGESDLSCSRCGYRRNATRKKQ